MHHDDEQRPTQRRETLLTVMLTGMALGGFLLFMIVVTGGFFFYVVLAVAVITGLGYLHYLVWGFSMTHEVDQERAEENDDGTTHERNGASNGIYRRRS